MRKCILSDETHPREDMIRVIVNREGEIFAGVTGKKQGRGAYVPKDAAMIEKAQQKEVLEKYFKVPRGQLDPVCKEIIGLIYGEEISK